MIRKVLIASILSVSTLISTAGVVGSASAASVCPAGQTVSDSSQLTNALATATPGKVIVLASGTYTGPFTLTKSGTSSAPITLCGPSTAILNGKGKSHAFYMSGASWWKLSGFQITNGKKGIEFANASHNTVTGVTVHDTDGAGIHVNSFSSYNVFDAVTVRNAGAEGFYVGSAVGNWCQYSNCQTDTSNYNIIRNSTVTATADEAFDLKEGTTGGQVLNNYVEGSQTDSDKGWVNVKGNNYLVSGNIATNIRDDGYQVHVVAQGWGNNNTFRGNTATNNGPGYGFYVQPGASGNIVACGQTVTGAGSGYANVACQP